MNIEASILALLKASPAVKGLVSGRIYVLILPETPTFPAITFQRISETPDSTLDGPGTFNEIRLQLDCWSTASHSEVSQIADAISGAINGFSGTSTGVTIYNVMRDGSQDMYEPTPPTYRRSIDFKVQFAV